MIDDCELEILSVTQITTALPPTGEAGWSLTLMFVGCPEHRVAAPKLMFKGWFPVDDEHILSRSIALPGELLFLTMKES